MEFILNNWYIILAVIAILAGGAMAMYRFFHLPSAEQLAKVKEWLLFAVTEAEKELGGGTGQIKLRYVYDMFVTKFPWLVKVISFEAFSGLVDEALANMRELLQKNNAVAALVEGAAPQKNGV